MFPMRAHTSLRSVIQHITLTDWQESAHELAGVMANTEASRADVARSEWIQLTLEFKPLVSLVMLRTYMSVQATGEDQKRRMARFEAVMSATLPILLASARHLDQADDHLHQVRRLTLMRLSRLLKFVRSSVHGRPSSHEDLHCC